MNSVASAPPDNLELFVGEPLELRHRAITVPTVLFKHKGRALTLSALLQRTYSPNENRPYFGTLGRLAQMTYQDEKTVSRHLIYWCRLRTKNGQTWLTKKGRQGRRTVTYVVDESLRQPFNGLTLAKGTFIRIPRVALQYLPTWNARLVFGNLTFRWLLPARNPDKFGDDIHTSEDIDVANCEFDFAKFRVARLAERLMITRQGVYDALDLIRSRGLATIAKSRNGSHHEFSLHVPVPETSTKQESS